MEHVEVCADLDHGLRSREAPRGLSGRGIHRRVRRQEKGDVEGHRRDLGRNEEDAAGEGYLLPPKRPPETYLGSSASRQARSHWRRPIIEPSNAGVGVEARARRKAPGGFGIWCPRSGNTAAFTTKHLAGKGARARQPVP
jgi:hypothetical protein